MSLDGLPQGTVTRKPFVSPSSNSGVNAVNNPIPQQPYAPQPNPPNPSSGNRLYPTLPNDPFPSNDPNNGNRGPYSGQQIPSPPNPYDGNRDKDSNGKNKDSSSGGSTFGGFLNFLRGGSGGSGGNDARFGSSGSSSNGPSYGDIFNALSGGGANRGGSGNRLFVNSFSCSICFSCFTYELMH